MVRKIRGFSLIELLVVIVIMAILLGIGIPMILNWIEKAKIREDARKIYSLIQQGREKAFTEKMNLQVEINSGKICLKQQNNGKNITCTKLNKTWQLNNSITISKRGIITGATIYYPSENDSPYDCVITSTTNVRMDKCNGNP